MITPAFVEAKKPPTINITNNIPKKLLDKVQIEGTNKRSLNVFSTFCYGFVDKKYMGLGYNLKISVSDTFIIQ